MAIFRTATASIRRGGGRPVLKRWGLLLVVAALIGAAAAYAFVPEAPTVEAHECGHVQYHQNHQGVTGDHDHTLNLGSNHGHTHQERAVIYTYSTGGVGGTFEYRHHADGWHLHCLITTRTGAERGDGLGGSAESPQQGSPGSSPQGSPGSSPQGTSGSPPQGSPGSSPQGTSGSPPQGTPPQGSPGSSPQGTSGSPPQGTPPQGSPGSSPQGSPQQPQSQPQQPQEVVQPPVMAEQASCYAPNNITLAQVVQKMNDANAQRITHADAMAFLRNWDRQNGFFCP